MTSIRLTSKVLVGLFALTLAAAYLPTATASSHTSLGSFVRVGDGDFRPTLNAPNVAGVPIIINICRIDFGIADTITDDSFYLNMDSDDDAVDEVETFDVRLNGFGGKGPGTLVTDGDTTETSAAAVCSDVTSDAGAGMVVWADADD
ncbi:MAG: hypothetical protein ACRDH5_11380, partial [bacterium]